MRVNKNRILMIHSSATSGMSDEDFLKIGKKRPSWDVSKNQFLNLGLRNKYPGGYTQAIKESKGIDSIWDMHVNELEWPYIGYQYVIEYDGTGIETIPGRENIRAYACGFTDKKYGFMNSKFKCYHICLLGHGDFEKATDHQVIELLKFLAINKEKFDTVVFPQELLSS